MAAWSAVRPGEDGPGDPSFYVPTFVKPRPSFFSRALVECVPLTPPPSGFLSFVRGYH
jgi:hypothetical protein